jgi:PD-(D/E)XK endonuclease
VGRRPARDARSGLRLSGQGAKSEQTSVRLGGTVGGVLSTNQKGTVAELKIAAAALEHGVGVAFPFDDERYDLILDRRPGLLRVQCKWASRVGDVIIGRLYTSRRGPHGLINRRYSAGEFDAFGLYCADTNECYLLPAIEFVALRHAYLRIAPTLNNQAVGVRWASDYAFGATLSRLDGPIAQLGERLAGSQKVAGSSPAGST